MRTKMPLGVRLFFLITIAMAGYFLFWSIWYVIYPSQHEIVSTARVLARIPQEDREKWREGFHRVAEYRLGVTFIWYSLIVSVAFLAAFRKKNWARWAFVILFVIIETMPIVIDTSYGVLGWSLKKFLSSDWYNPLHYKFELSYLAAIVCAFGGNASDWFRPARELSSSQ